MDLFSFQLFFLSFNLFFRCLPKSQSASPKPLFDFLLMKQLVFFQSISPLIPKAVTLLFQSLTLISKAVANLLRLLILGVSIRCPPLEILLTCLEIKSPPLFMEGTLEGSPLPVILLVARQGRRNSKLATGLLPPIQLLVAVVPHREPTKLVLRCLLFPRTNPMSPSWPSIQMVSVQLVLWRSQASFPSCLP